MPDAGRDVDRARATRMGRTGARGARSSRSSSLDAFDEAGVEEVRTLTAGASIALRNAKG